MIVHDSQSLSTSSKQYLLQNPFTNDQSLTLDSISRLEKYISSNTRDISDFETRLKDAKMNVLIYKQQLNTANRKLQHINQMIKNTESEFNFDIIQPSKMKEFFKAINLEFIGVSFSRNDECHLLYIRPTKNISELPTPPMIVEITYEVINSVFTFKQAKVHVGIANQSYFHPHISTDGKVCLGNYLDKLLVNKVGSTLDFYQDHVILLEELLQTYNSDSPFKSVDNILAHLITYGLSCNSKPVNFLNDSYEVLTHINFIPRPYSVTELIGIDMYEDYYKALDNIDMKGVAQDTIHRLESLTSDNSSEDYDFMVDYERALKTLFKDSIKFDDVHQYSTIWEDEDNDYQEYDVLDEDGFCDLKDSWIESLEEFISKDVSVTATIAKLDLSETVISWEVEDVSN